MEAHLGEVEGGLANSFGDTLTGTGVKTLEHFPLPGSREEQVAACNPSDVFAVQWVWSAFNFEFLYGYQCPAVPLM